MDKVVVEIFGERYSLRSDTADAAYIREVAALVDSYMRKAASQTHSFSGTRTAVLAALQLADEYCRLKKDYDDLMEMIK